MAWTQHSRHRRRGPDGREVAQALHSGPKGCKVGERRCKSRTAEQRGDNGWGWVYRGDVVMRNWRQVAQRSRKKERAKGRLGWKGQEVAEKGAHERKGPIGSGKG